MKGFLFSILLCFQIQPGFSECRKPVVDCETNRCNGSIAIANGIQIWYQTFGEKENPAFLLIMGGGCQGTLWPVEFCENLAEQGFYVIRYDHRDAGFSTCVDFEQDPYDHLDMAKDAIGLLDFLGTEKAHLLGLSMGGSIAQILAAHFPDRVLSLGLMGTSSDFEPLSLAMRGLPSKEGALPGPRTFYLEAMDDFMNNPPNLPEEELQRRIALWELLNGSKVPLGFESQQTLHQEFLRRVRQVSCLNNHLFSIYLSEELLRDASSRVKVPTVIFQGTEDPIFPQEHGQALHEGIANSNFYLLEGHGHVPNPYFFDFIIGKLVENAARAPSGF